MKKIGKHLPGLLLCALCFLCAFVMPVNAENSHGIDANAPCEGQEDVITYSGKEETYEVKVTGIYDITVCGGQGGTGLGYVSNKDLSKVSPDTPGSYGSKTQSRIFLKKGTKLTVHVGSVGGTGHLGHHSKDELWAGSGGWSDGERGKTAYNFDSSNKNKDCSISTGGGGGSSYLLYEGEKILSAAGGGSATMTLKRHDLRTLYGASGGGSSQIKDAGDLIWMKDDLNVMESGANSGDGKIVFKLVRPRVGMVLQRDRDDWTTEHVTVRAEITSTGEGVPDDCFFWDYEPEGDSDDTDTEGASLGEWTDEGSITVHANGTVSCKIRDVNENEAEATLQVTNIDRKGPRISRELSPDDWTTEPVTLTIKASDEGGCGIADEGYLWSDDTALSPDDEGDYELQWNATTSKTYDENTSVTVTVRDKLGNRTEQKIEIANIDRTAPTVRLVPEGKWTSGEMTFTIEALDLQPDGKTEGAGLPEDAYSVDGENYTNERTILVTEPGTVTVRVRDKLGNLTESHISVSYDKEKSGDKSGSGKDSKGGKNGKGKGGKSASDAGGNADTANATGEGALPAEGETSVQIPGLDVTSAVGDLNLNAEREALQAGRKAKRKTAPGEADAARYGVITKEEEPAFAEIVEALSGGDVMQLDRLTGDEAGAGSRKNGTGDDSELTAGGGVKRGVLASVSAGAKWVLRIIQKWKHVITYSLGGLIFFSLLGLGAVFFLVWKRKKRN